MRLLPTTTDSGEVKIAFSRSEFLAFYESAIRPRDAGLGFVAGGTEPLRPREGPTTIYS